MWLLMVLLVDFGANGFAPSVILIWLHAWLNLLIFHSTPIIDIQAKHADITA